MTGTIQMMYIILNQMRKLNMKSGFVAIAKIRLCK